MLVVYAPPESVRTPPRAPGAASGALIRSGVPPQAPAERTEKSGPPIDNERALGFIKKKDVPYNVAFIELAEGPRIIANVVGARNEELHIGMPVEVVFEDVNDEISLPKFRKAGAASQATGERARP